MPELDSIHRVEFLCRTALHYGHPLTILAEPEQSANGWLCLGSNGPERVQVLLAEWVGQGNQLIVVSRREWEDDGYRHTAVDASELEAYAELIEDRVLRALGTVGESKTPERSNVT